MAEMLKRKDFLENEVVDLREEIALTSPTDTPLTTLLMGRGAVVPATDITVTWRERKLNETRGTLKLEGAEAGDPIKSSRSTLSNLCQIIEKVTQVSGTAQALNPKGIGKSFEAEINDRLIETKRDLEWYFLNGTKAAGSETVPRQMNGLVNLVNADNVVDATEGLTEILMLDAMQKMWDHGSQGEYFTFVNAGTKRIINSLIKADGNIRINTEQGLNQVLGITVQKIESDFGTLNLVLDRHMDAKATYNFKRYEWLIFSWDYGEEYTDLLGYSYTQEYLESEVERMITECVTQHPYITGIQDLKVTVEKDKLHITFTLLTDLGEVEIDV